jgi:hypothetical protein
MSIPGSEFLENLETDFETLDNGLSAREPRDKIVNRQQRIEIQHLATLTPFDCEKCRKIKAKKMGVRIDTLDKEVHKARRKTSAETHLSTSFRSAPGGSSGGGTQVGNYRETGHGFIRVQIVKGQEIEIPLINFTARIISDITHDDGAETTRAFEIEARLEERTTTFIVPVLQFIGMRWPTEHPWCASRRLCWAGNGRPYSRCDSTFFG